MSCGPLYLDLLVISAGYVERKREMERKVNNKQSKEHNGVGMYVFCEV
jgi:hypothetical protein